MASVSKICISIPLIAGIGASIFLVLVGTTNPTQSLILLAIIPVTSLLASWGALKSDRPYLACALLLYAALGIPLVMMLSYLRSGV